MSSETLFHNEVWPALKLEAASSNSVVAAVAYVTNTEDFQFRARDILVLDASPTAIQSGKTCVKVLELLFEQGVSLYSCPNLHAKVYAFERSVAVGSANLSSSSRNTLVECAILSRDIQLVSNTKAWITQLASRSLQVDREYLNLMKSIAENLQLSSGGQIAPENLWYLVKPPNALKRSMRAYFLAIIIAQLGGVYAWRPFRLWPGADFRQHVGKARMQTNGMNFELTQQGIDYFCQPKQWPNSDLLQIFLAAVKSGNGAKLPVEEMQMLRMPSE